MTTRSTSIRAAVVATLCVAGCLAGPLAIGALAALAGALTFGWLAAVAALAAAGAAGTMAVRRRRGAC